MGILLGSRTPAFAPRSLASMPLRMKKPAAAGRMVQPSEAIPVHEEEEERASEEDQFQAEETKSMSLDEKMQWARKKGVQPEELQAVLEAGDFKKSSP